MAGRSYHDASCCTSRVVSVIDATINIGSNCSQVSNRSSCRSSGVNEGSVSIMDNTSCTAAALSIVVGVIMSIIADSFLAVKQLFDDPRSPFGQSSIL